ncbi:MAG: polyphosphate:AMP phosphotransferase [Phycisphaeraceae bacterium]|nr:polyphosphate:AMP phosphotransferase [Phycisphaeraceae bacterium]
MGPVPPEYFAPAETGASVSKAEFNRREPELRYALLQAQFALQKADFPVLVVVTGDDRWGCNALIDRLHEWLDARRLRTEVFLELREDQLQRPPWWRYWVNLPKRGQIGLFMGAWPLRAIAHRISGRIDDAGFETRLVHARTFEKMQVDDGALVLKYWLHQPKDEHKRRLKKARKNPDRYWYVEDADWDIYDRYDQVMPLAGRYVQETDSESARWHVVDSTDKRHRDLVVAESILSALKRRMEAGSKAGVSKPITAAVPPKNPRSLASLDLTARLTEQQYDAEKETWQRKLNALARRAHDRDVTALLVFEGADAAGKGGAIRRITQALPARLYRLISIAAPTDEERAHHYLWRFWRRLPRTGHLGIFDRSWYGRVLVERVEGYARAAEWGRAYGEINDFEAQMVEFGWPVVKFYLHIDRDEQQRRFESRRNTPHKQHKITDEDLRNRSKWDRYQEAAEQMFAETDTAAAPWHLVATNDKRWARIEVLRTVCGALTERLKA